MVTSLAALGRNSDIKQSLLCLHSVRTKSLVLVLSPSFPLSPNHNPGTKLWTLPTSSRPVAADIPHVGHSTFGTAQLQKGWANHLEKLSHEKSSVPQALTLSCHDQTDHDAPLCQICHESINAHPLHQQSHATAAQIKQDFGRRPWL